jgi:tetratricopeptide (TPR) repeat protein
MSDTVTVDPLEAGREAYARRAWPEAYRLLLEADGGGGLDPEDLEALAKSAWWIGLATESIAAFERAYGLHLERGNRSMAAMMALTLRREYGAKLAGSVAQAWLHRAEHLLEGEPEAVAHGYLEIARRELDFDRGDIDGALAHLDRAMEIASRLDDADLPVWVAISRAEVLGTSGRLDEAFGLME